MARLTLFKEKFENTKS